MPRPRTGGGGNKGTTTQRGYGWAHQTARAQALDHLEDGTPCPRCGRPMYRSQQLDLDHTDDRQAYRGLAHAGCNRRAGQAKAVRNRRAKTSTTLGPTPRSRNW